MIPMQEIEHVLEQHLSASQLDEKIALIEQAITDPPFLVDLRETMDAFAPADAE